MPIERSLARRFLGSPSTSFALEDLSHPGRRLRVLAPVGVVLEGQALEGCLDHLRVRLRIELEDLVERPRRRPAAVEPAETASARPCPPSGRR
jgi:hypothetical protein